jgi:hypothetical protein
MTRTNSDKLTTAEVETVKRLLRAGAKTKAILLAVPNINSAIVSYWRCIIRNEAASTPNAAYDSLAAAYFRPVCREGACQESPIGKTHFCARHTAPEKPVKQYSDFISPIPLSRKMAGR